MHKNATIDFNALPSNEIRPIRSQKQYRLCDIQRSARTTYRYGRFDFLMHILRGENIVKSKDFVMNLLFLCLWG